MLQIVKNVFHIVHVHVTCSPALTWRDVQHLTVLTSKRNHLYDANRRHEWTINGAGLEFNHLFGYGVLDAGDMVKMAQAWRPLPERYHCTAGSILGKQYAPVLAPVPAHAHAHAHTHTSTCPVFVS